MSEGFQISPPIVNNKEVFLKRITFVIVATDLTTNLNYDVTQVSSLEFQQVDMASFTPLGASTPSNAISIPGSNQPQGWEPGQLHVYGQAVNIATLTAVGSKGFVAAADWMVTAYVTMEFWYSN